ncbi:MAG: GNAT family N-acetyltransferase, partial [Nocardioidaceae bacterium]
MLIRPMNDDDVPAVEQVTGTAFYHVDVATRPANWPDPEPRSPQRAELWKTRMHHLLKHDSPGCWVAEDRAGAVVGCAAALLREGMFGLSVLAVLPDLQAQGIGRQLLDAALSYAPSGPGFICSSQDAKAIRRYRLAGFDIHPAMLMWGHVR